MEVLEMIVAIPLRKAGISTQATAGGEQTRVSIPI